MALYSVTFSELYLHDFSDFATYQTLTPSQFELQATRTESIVPMVNGRRVSITTQGTSRVWTVTLAFASRTIVDWLVSNEGVPYLVRSPFGDLFYATFNGVARSEQLLPGVVHDTTVGSISFILSEIDE